MKCKMFDKYSLLYRGQSGFNPNNRWDNKLLFIGDPAMTKMPPFQINSLAISSVIFARRSGSARGLWLFAQDSLRAEKSKFV